MLPKVSIATWVPEYYYFANMMDRSRRESTS